MTYYSAKQLIYNLSHTSREKISRFIRRRPGAAALGLCCSVLLLLTGCSSDKELPVTKNPFYQKGLQLRENSRYKDAAESFQKALRLSPNSGKIHLQLAMLHEDHLDDPLLAVVHYKKYLQLAEEKNITFAEEWLDNAERELLQRLQQKYGEANLAEPAAEPPEPEPDPDRVTEREKNLARTIKKLNSRIVELERQLHEKDAPPLQSPSAPPADSAAPAATVHIVKKGESLSSISRQHYGSARYWQELRDWNSDKITSGDIIMPDMKLEIPPLEKLTEGR